jgi:hypothetical protein
MFEFKVLDFHIYSKYEDHKSFHYGDDIALAVVKLNKDRNKGYKADNYIQLDIPPIDFACKDIEMIQEGDIKIPVVLNGYPLKIYNNETSKWDDNKNFMYRSTGKL